MFRVDLAPVFMSAAFVMLHGASIKKYQ